MRSRGDLILGGTLLSVDRYRSRIFRSPIAISYCTGTTVEVPCRAIKVIFTLLSRAILNFETGGDFRQLAGLRTSTSLMTQVRYSK